MRRPLVIAPAAAAATLLAFVVLFLASVEAAPRARAAESGQKFPSFQFKKVIDLPAGPTADDARSWSRNPPTAKYAIPHQTPYLDRWVSVRTEDEIESNGFFPALFMMHGFSSMVNRDLGDRTWALHMQYVPKVVVHPVGWRYDFYADFSFLNLYGPWKTPTSALGQTFEAVVGASQRVFCGMEAETFYKTGEWYGGLEGASGAGGVGGDREYRWLQCHVKAAHPNSRLDEINSYWTEAAGGELGVESFSTGCSTNGYLSPLPQYRATFAAVTGVRSKYVADTGLRVWSLRCTVFQVDDTEHPVVVAEPAGGEAGEGDGSVVVVGRSAADATAAVPAEAATAAATPQPSQHRRWSTGADNSEDHPDYRFDVHIEIDAMPNPAHIRKEHANPGPVRLFVSPATTYVDAFELRAPQLAMMTGLSFQRRLLIPGAFDAYQTMYRGSFASVPRFTLTEVGTTPWSYLGQGWIEYWTSHRGRVLCGMDGTEAVEVESRFEGNPLVLDRRFRFRECQIDQCTRRVARWNTWVSPLRYDFSLACNDRVEGKYGPDGAEFVAVTGVRAVLFQSSLSRSWQLECSAFRSFDECGPISVDDIDITPANGDGEPADEPVVVTVPGAGAGDGNGNGDDVVNAEADAKVAAGVVAVEPEGEAPVEKKEAAALNNAPIEGKEP